MIAMKFAPASPSSSSASLPFLISCLMGSHVIMFNHGGSPFRSGWIMQPLRSVKRCLPELKRRDKELGGGHETTHTIWGQTEATIIAIPFAKSVSAKPLGTSPTVRNIVYSYKEKLYKVQDNDKSKHLHYILLVTPWLLFKYCTFQILRPEKNFEILKITS